MKQQGTYIDTSVKLSRETEDKIGFICFIVPEFASGYKMNMQKAYLYLKQYGGIEYLNKHWWALHTDNPYWVIRSMAKVCRNNGGYL